MKRSHLLNKKLSHIVVEVIEVYEDGEKHVEKFENAKAFLGYMLIEDEGKERYATATCGDVSSQIRVFSKVPEMLTHTMEHLEKKLDEELEKTKGKGHSCRSCGGCHHD